MKEQQIFDFHHLGMNTQALIRLKFWKYIWFWADFSLEIKFLGQK